MGQRRYLRLFIVAALWLGVAVALGWPITRLASWLAARSLARLTPAPFATIDSPAANASVPAEVIVAGHAAHETIRAPLWLLVSEAGGPWEPQAAVNTSGSTWRQAIRLTSRNGTHCRLVIAAVELPLQNELRRRVAKRSEPAWYWSSPEGWEQSVVAMRGWKTAPLGGGSYPALPAGARLVASVDVVIADDRAGVLETDPLPRYPH